MTELLARHRAGFDMHALAAYLPRLFRWQMVTTGVLTAWAVTSWRATEVDDASGAVWIVRFAVVIGALGAAFALDDPSRDVTESSIGARERLVPLRLSAVILTTCIASAPAWFVAMRELSGADAAGLIVEVVAVLSLVCAVALTLQRQWRILEPAQYVVFVVLLVAVADQATAGRWPLLIPPGPGWSDAHWRWFAMGVVALLLLTWQLRDPAAGRGWWKVGSRRSRDQRNPEVASRGDYLAP